MAIVAATNPKARAGAGNRRMKLCLAFLFCFVLLIPVDIVAQSGRRKDAKSNPATVKRNPGPIAEPRSSNGSASDKDSEDEIDPNDVVRVNANLVPIPASIFDPHGVAVTDLKLDDFELLVDGQVRPITDLSRSETSVRMAMLFDNSGSLDSARDFEKEAAIHFFRRVMRPIDEAAVYSVETESYLAQPLTRDVSKLQQTIRNFGKPEGSTSLFDAIVDASTYLKPYAGRRVLVIVSDGIETTSRVDFDTTMQRVMANDCQIFVVQTGLYEGANLRALAAERRMEQLTLQTGGAVYLPKTVGELNAAFDQIASDLAQQYIVSYYPAGDHRDGKFHSLDLRVKARKDVRIRSRRGYYSPKSDSSRANDW
jgi:Ca-activated chloride channel homolog